MVAQNLLLAAFPPEVLERLTRHMRTVDLAHGEILHRPNQSIDTVYFPLDCLISITVTMEEGHTVEAGAVGSREMVGVNAFMGGRETNQTEYICQIPGKAVKMAAEPLLNEFDQVKAGAGCVTAVRPSVRRPTLPERRLQSHPLGRAAVGPVAAGVPRPARR
jgi:hypothetical protein